MLRGERERGRALKTRGEIKYSLREIQRDKRRERDWENVNFYLVIVKVGLH